MSTSEERSRSWPAEPESTSATGGHMPPEVEPSGPLFDPLFDPLTSDAAARVPVAPRPPRRDGLPHPADDAGLRTSTDPGRRPRRVRKPRPAVRRVRRQLKRVDPWSVLKVSVFFYACFLVVWLGFVAVVYWIVQAMGLFDLIESVGKGFAFEFGRIDVSLWLVERWAFLVGMAGLILMSLVNTFLAVLYNLGSDLMGGVEMTFVERDL